MPNTMFASREEFLRHIVNPLPLSQGRGDELFRAFQDFGYLARQEEIGLSVLPVLAGGSLWGLPNEGIVDAPGQLKVVMLSHPSLTDDDYDSWVEIMRGWAAGLTHPVRVALSRKFRALNNVEHGVGAHVLHEGIPRGLLLSYQRPNDFVIVVDRPGKNKRRVYTTREIG
jgi:hypothetical protein